MVASNRREKFQKAGENHITGKKRKKKKEYLQETP